jgi:predicted phosphodiesterase
MKITELNRNVHKINIDGLGTGEQWFLLSSDHHWDNPDANREMIERHLIEAKERNAPVFIFGDFFCAMQGKYDKRSDKSKVRPEHQVANYLDSLVDTAANWLMPYRDNIAVIGQGNHETAILKNHETNLIERLVERLNVGRESKTYVGGYGGYIWLQIARQTETEKTRGALFPLKIKYYHGHGGGGPVTKGVIQSARQSMYLPDADIVVSGHVHEQYSICFMQERLKDSGKIELKEQWHLRLPTYKDEYKDGYGGWHIETGKMPKPIGAYWMVVKIDRYVKNGVEHNKLVYDFIKAK